jgi:hypothetical protein
MHLQRAGAEQRPAGGMLLRDEDLLEDEPQIFRVDVETLADRRNLLLRFDGRHQPV